MWWMEDEEAPAKVTGLVLPPYRLTALFAGLTIALGFLVSAVATTDGRSEPASLAGTVLSGEDELSQ